ncbi:Maltose O-acetyltransferase [Thalassocella blandensis]|nr:Maltose O-acetyltransferase [Thalassocella blandensis]
MRKEHKPFLIKKLQRYINNVYVERIVRPQFDSLGICPFFLRPQSLQITGKNISAGHHLHIISEKHQPVKMFAWSSKQEQGHIRIGDHCLISPGVNIASAINIEIGHNCMIAADVNISDSDWHGLYNRTRPFKCSAPIVIHDNVWIGLRAIIGKGVTIGENSVIAAGSVVIQDIEANCVAGGNPAKVIKKLNPRRRMLKRDVLFDNVTQDPQAYLNNQIELDKYLLHNNTFFNWIRSKISPGQND